MLLEGIRVLDLTRLAPGPLCTMTLGDMGADVLKVEDTGPGDYMRTHLFKQNKESRTFLALNRNKRSITLNLKTPEGKEILRKLILDYDVLVEGFRPGVMDRLGLGYEALKQINPKLIYLSLTGYGQDGPYAQKAGHDLNYVAEAGILNTFVEPDGKPIYPGIYLGDMLGGIWSVIGVLSAIVHRERTGQGQYVDVSMYDSLMPLLNLYVSRLFHYGHYQYWGPAGPYYGIYRTKDQRYVTVGAMEHKFFQRLCELLERPELADWMLDEGKHPALRAELEAIFAGKTQAEWTALLAGEDATYAPVMTVEETFADPHFNHRNMNWKIEHPIEGLIQSIGFPLKFREDPAGVTRRPPLYGEHTAQVLEDIGYSAGELEALRTAGVIK